MQAKNFRVRKYGVKAVSKRASDSYKNLNCKNLRHFETCGYFHKNQNREKI